MLWFLLKVLCIFLYFLFLFRFFYSLLFLFLSPSFPLSLSSSLAPFLLSSPLYMLSLSHIFFLLSFTLCLHCNIYLSLFTRYISVLSPLAFTSFSLLSFLPPPFIFFLHILLSFLLPSSFSASFHFLLHCTSSSLHLRLTPSPPHPTTSLHLHHVPPSFLFTELTVSYTSHHQLSLILPPSALLVSR